MRKGISLVALVITILTATVMIVFKEGGILGKSEEAVFKSDFSNILDSFMLNKNELMLENLCNVDIIATDENEIKENILILQNNNKIINNHSYTSLIQIYNSKIYQSDMIVNSNNEKDKEISRWLEEIGIGKKEINVPEKLLDYILGKDRNGRLLSEILNDTTFINEADTIPNASNEVKYMNSLKENVSTTLYYIKYDEIAYRIKTVGENSSKMTQTLTRMYAKSSDENNWEGREVDFSADGDPEKLTKWLVLYDNGTTVDIVSIKTMGALTLGSGDTNATGNTISEKVSDSYNNVVERLNDYCASLVTNEDAIAVRSVGSNPIFGVADTTSMYNSSNLQIWFDSRNNELKVTDTNCEQDLVRMSYFPIGSNYTIYGYTASNNRYWLASRLVIEDYAHVEFGVRWVKDGSADYGYHFWHVFDGFATYYNPAFQVRPVVRVDKSKL